MAHWLRDNLLAAYGAVVGTIALLLNVVRFSYDRSKDSVQLRVSARASPDLRSNASRLADTPSESEMDAPRLLPGFQVTVYNDGLVAAHIAEIGVIDANGKDVTALVHRPKARDLMLWPVGEAGLDAISGKSSQTFTVYLRTGEGVPTVTGCFVVDKTGKRWKGRYSES